MSGKPAFDPNKLDLIVSWVYDVASKTRAPEEWGSGEAARKAVLSSYAKFLYDDFPSNIFKKDTVSLVLLKHEFFPSYKALHEILTAWQKEHRPNPVPQLEYAAFATWSVMDHLWLRYWNIRRDEGFGPTEKNGMRYAGTSEALVLDLIKRESPNVHAYLSREGFAPKVRDVQDGYSEAATRATLDKLRDHPMRPRLVTMYRELLTKQAPHLLPLIDAFEAEPKAA